MSVCMYVCMYACMGERASHRRQALRKQTIYRQGDGDYGGDEHKEDEQALGIGSRVRVKIVGLKLSG